MSTNRRKKRPRRIIIPAWAAQILAGGRRPTKDSLEYFDFINWRWGLEDVAGLPDPQSFEGEQLLQREIQNRLG